MFEHPNAVALILSESMGIVRVISLPLQPAKAPVHTNPEVLLIVIDSRFSQP